MQKLSLIHICKGIRNYMIEIGGEIVVKGLSPKEQKWKVGINKPIDDSLTVSYTHLELLGTVLRRLPPRALRLAQGCHRV